MRQRIWLGFTIIAIVCTSLASVQTTASGMRHGIPNEQERRLFKTPGRTAEFSDISQIMGRSGCENATPPQPLTTPDPLLVPGKDVAKIKVSFIVGTDGRVYSPLILESGGASGDHNILLTVRAWRYRPATCNGVPTEVEGKIEFSRR